MNKLNADDISFDGDNVFMDNVLCEQMINFGDYKMKTYREVLCPDCHRKYMTYVYSDEYDVVIELESGSLYGWSDSCPKCSNSLFIEDNVLEGKRMEDFPDNKVHQRYILR